MKYPYIFSFSALTLLASHAMAAPTLTKIADTCVRTLIANTETAGYFLSGDDIWVSDGTSVGTKLFAKGALAHPQSPSWTYYPVPKAGRAAAKGIVIYGDLHTDDPVVGAPSVYAIWFVSPTGSIDRSSSLAVSDDLKLGSNVVLFTSKGVYHTDGTASGTTLAAAWPGISVTSGFSSVLTSDGTTAIVKVRNDQTSTIDYFSTDGTASGTKRLTNAPIAFASYKVPSFLDRTRGARIGNFLYLPDTTTHNKLVRVDLTSPTWSEAVVADFTPYNKIYGVGITSVTDATPSRFIVRDGNFTDWVSDGSKADKFSMGLDSLTPIGDRVGILSSDGAYLSDLTTTGTIKLATASKTGDAGSGRGKWVGSVGGKTYFTMDDGVHGPDLWSTDGTPAGTVFSADISSGTSASTMTLYSGINSTTLLTTVAANGCAIYTMTDPSWITPDAGASDVGGNDASVADAGAAQVADGSTAQNDPAATNGESNAGGCTLGVNDGPLPWLGSALALLVAALGRFRARNAGTRIAQSERK